MSTTEEDALAAAAASAALTLALAGPKRVRGDAGEVEQHSLKDLIELDKYQRSKTAGATRGFGLRTVQGKPPGAV